ncbi:Calcium-dependent protein kinase 13 [Pleodorina starrii]|uniref:Calcium-dependent protein kinase 13 n=1 Tax=Pleodorina starrii TaxID=330485 RepID=A0A9W6BP68_9CHLO|nr:Calcium-dependent protein kinase 13 [Pleodorina starrii]GLC55729.1 Calcium-dependent protein kinase 13 [Pleodorina starrii]GLC65476.1 Calcium-dependent protein kinase 13 [Pleodorina starrii]
MGGRSSKVTVSRTEKGNSVPTDAAFRTVASEYASSKQQTGSGRIAWDFQSYAVDNTERDSKDVEFIDRESPAQSSARPVPSSRASPKGLNNDKKVWIQAQAAAGASEKACVREAAGVPSTTAGDKAGAASPSAPSHATNHSQAKPPPAIAGAVCPSPTTDTQQKRPGTGRAKDPKDPKIKRNGKTGPEMAPRAPPPPPPPPPPSSPPPPQSAAATAVAAAAATNAAAAGAAFSTPRENAIPAMRPGAPAPPAPVAQPGPGADAAVAAASAAGGAAAGSADGPSATAAAAVQWVIRPGPPIESAYKLGKVLGQGSFGVVRLASHLASGAEVAVKTIRKCLLRSADVASLRREVEILHHLSGHPAISQLLGVYEEPRQLHLVLELYKGGDLFDAIIGVGRHSERTAADVMRTVLTAIAYCHAMGVAHRDIKPENFMLTAELPKGFQPQPQPPPPQQQQPQQQPQGPVSRALPLAPPLVGIGSRLKLIDFGLSAFCTDDTPLTETVGTSYYVAPEVLEGRYSLPADVWSAGVIFHIMLTGYAPFDGKDDREILRAVRKGKLDLTADPIWKSISAEAAAVLTAMLERDPKKRATAEEVLATPWLGRTPETCEAPSAPLPGVVSERLHRFARMSSFKKEARRVVAGLMRPEEVAGLVAQFRGLDTDRDGRISLGELREGIARQALLRRAGGGGPHPGPAPLSDEQLKDLLRRSDLNGDGLLDESEFLGAALPVAALARQAPRDVARAGATAPRPASGGGGGGGAMAAAFKHFDADGSGFITVEELRRALAHHHPPGKGPDVQMLLSLHDRDADGRISYPEFVDMLVQDVEDDQDDMSYNVPAHGPARHEQLPAHRLTPQGGGSVRFSNCRGAAAAAAAAPVTSGDVAGHAPMSRGSAAAWSAGGVEPSSASTAFAAATKGRGSRCVSRSSTAAAQLPSGRLSPLEWSDECLDSDDEAAAAAAAAAVLPPPSPSSPPPPSAAPWQGSAAVGKAADSPAAVLTAARGSGGGTAAGAAAAAPHIPSRFSQPQLHLQPHPPPSDAPFASAAVARMAGRCSSGGANRRGSIGGRGPTPPDAAEAAGDGSGGGLNRMAEVQDLSEYDIVYGGGGGVAAAAAATPAVQQSGRRPPPPPPLQLPAQPAVDMRSRRHSAGGMPQYDRATLAATGAGAATAIITGGSSMRPADSRVAPSPFQRHLPAEGAPNPGTPTYPSPTAQSLAANSLPGSPSAAAAAAAAAAHRMAAGRVSTGNAPPPPQLQQRSPPLPALQAVPSGSGFERPPERASCPQTSVGWPPSPSPGGGAAATAAAAARTSRASVTGMLPARSPPPWAAAAPSAAAAASAAPLHAAPPSAPLPVLHTAGLRSRRQSTGGSPAWPLPPPAAAVAAAAAAAPPAPPAYHSQPLYQLPQARHNYSVSCSGGGVGVGGVSGVGGYGNALSPRVPAVATEWGGGGGGASAGRRSRRTTQQGLLPAAAGGEDLILTSRASCDMDGAAGSTGAIRTFPVSGASDDDAASFSHVLPPGATGLGFGASYNMPYNRHLRTSGSGRLL